LPDDYTHTRLNAYQANQVFGGPSSMDAGPCWCFDRFGQSETTLPNGRIVYVGGEHEDFYDPDFYIYNDVVIVDTSGNIQILGYPTEVFPPTDFHSATLVDNGVILIGNLGYADARPSGQTQVLRLELDTWRISTIETFGDLPGWIHGHKAELSPDRSEIHITGGEVDRGEGQSLLENIDEWSLDLQTWRWKRLTHREWTRFILRRKDKKWNHLSEMRNSISQEVYERLAEQNNEFAKVYKQYGKFLRQKTVTLPDPKLLETLYAPDVATEIIGKDEEKYGVHRIRVGDVIVRYVEDSYSITVTIEGELPTDVVEQLRNDVTTKFAALERVPIACETILPN